MICTIAIQLNDGFMEPQVFLARFTVQIEGVELETGKVEGVSIGLDTLHDGGSGQVFDVILYKVTNDLVLENMCAWNCIIVNSLRI